MKNNTPITISLLTASLMADFIVIATHECNINELERVQKCLEIFNRKHGCCCNSELDELNDNIYQIKHKDMIREKFLEMMAEGKINLNGCQVNLGDGSTQNNYYTDKVNDTQKNHGQQNEHLSGELAKQELAKYQKAGFLDDDFQPINLTRPQMGCIVLSVGNALGLTSQWKDFGTLWDIDSEQLRSQFNKGKDSEPTRNFFKKIYSL